MSDPRICPRCGAGLPHDQTIVREDLPHDQRTPWQSQVLGELPKVEEKSEETGG